MVFRKLRFSAVSMLYRFRTTAVTVANEQMLRDDGKSLFFSYLILWHIIHRI